MGFSTSGGTAVLFVGLFISAGIFVPAVSGSLEDVSGAVDRRDDRMVAVRNTGVAVANATYNATTDRLTVEVNNTGTTTLSVDAVDVLVDGTMTGGEFYPRTVSVEGVAGRSVVAPGETATVVVRYVHARPDRVLVAVRGGVEAAEGVP